MNPKELYRITPRKAGRQATKRAANVSWITDTTAGGFAKIQARGWSLDFVSDYVWRRLASSRMFGCERRLLP